MAAVTYTTRKGKKFYLRKRQTKSGKPRYVFMRESGPDALSRIPQGYEVVESIQGVVSCRKRKAQPISDLELRAVRSVLARHPHLMRCRAAAKRSTIEIYEPNGPTRYDAVMRFVLVDKASRNFSAERMCYRSWCDGWRSLHRTGPLRELAEAFVPHIGRESFYEL